MKVQENRSGRKIAEPAGIGPDAAESGKSPAAQKPVEAPANHCEESFRMLFENTSDVIYSIGTDLKILSISPSVERLLGYRPDEIVGRFAYEVDFLPAASLEKGLSDLTRILNGETVAAGDYQFIARDGTLRSAEVSGAPLYRGAEITGVICVARDHTEQKKIAERRERLEEEEQRNRETLERLAKETAMIAEIGRLISSTLEIDEVYEGFSALVRKLIPFDRLGINLCSLPENTLRVAYVSGTEIANRKPADVAPLTGTLSEVVMRERTGQILQPDDAEEVVRRMPALGETFRTGLRSLMSVPLISRNEVIGVLNFRSKTEKLYTDHDLRLAEKIGAQIAGAIAIAQLFSDVRKTESSLRTSEGRFRALFEMAATGVAEIDMTNGHFLTVNRRLCQMVGRTEEELLATTFQAITHPEDLQLHLEKTRRLLAGEIDHYSLEKRYLRKDGETVWVEITVSPLWRPGEPPGRNITIVQDITDRKWIEAENERRSRQMAALHQISLELTAELNLNTLLQSIAERALELIGGQSCNCYIYRPELDLIERVAITGQELVLGGKMRQRGEGIVGHVWATGVPLVVNDYYSWPGRKKEYDHFPNRALMAVPIRWGDEFLGILNMLAYTPHEFTTADKEMLSLFAMQAAIAIRNARLYCQIEQLSVTDELTHLFNRRGFFQLGEREVDRALRFGRPLSALMLDIDHFKRINDTYGHSGGDQVLQALADCFRRSTRAIDITGRYGGEEFALLLPEISQAEAFQIAERLRQSVGDLAIPLAPEQNHCSPTVISITASIGVAALSQERRSLADLLDRADQALYRAKDAGRNRVVVWPGR